MSESKYSTELDVDTLMQHSQNINSQIENYRRWVLQRETALRNSRTSREIMRGCLENTLVLNSSIARLTEVLLIEAYVLRDHGSNFQTDPVMLYALASEHCPEETLSKTCHCPNPAYRAAAAANIRCPEEDRVWAALMDLNDSPSI